MKTKKDLIDLIKKHKKNNCPAYSNKKKDELLKIVNNLNLKKSEVKKPEVKKPTVKKAKVKLYKNSLIEKLIPGINVNADKNLKPLKEEFYPDENNIKDMKKYKKILDEKNKNKQISVVEYNRIIKEVENRIKELEVKKPSVKKETEKKESGSLLRNRLRREQLKEYKELFNKFYGREWNPDKDNIPFVLNMAIKDLKEKLKEKPTVKKSSVKKESKEKLNKKEKDFINKKDKIKKSINKITSAKNFKQYKEQPKIDKLEEELDDVIKKEKEYYRKKFGN